MWCTRCHADVAAELAENGQALHCASCGHEIQKIYTPSLHPETRSARELLERWSREERIAPPPAAPATTIPDEPISSAAASAPVSDKPPAPVRTAAGQVESTDSPAASSARAGSMAPPPRPEPAPSKLISTNIAAVPAPPSDPLPAPEPAPFRDSSPPPQGSPVPVSESKEAESTEARPRRMLERPAMSRTSKPKGVWRADSAHIPPKEGAGDEIPKTVASLESIDTQTIAPPPPPVRPPRATFASPTSPLASSTPTPAAASSAPPAFTSERKSPDVAKPADRTSLARETARGAKEARSGSDPQSSAPRGEKRRRRRIDASHSGTSQTPRPHFDLQTYLEQNPNRIGRSETLWGQLVAYAGVAVLTIGTTMVLWGYFGGLGKYTSTGFLISTAGQMLLFLGVVTLVSGGMQQTSHEVTTRVEYLGDRMIRMEQATQQVLRSPHFARRRNRRGRPPSEASVPRSESSDAA